MSSKLQLDVITHGPWRQGQINHSAIYAMA